MEEILKMFKCENGIFLVLLLAHFVGNTYNTCPYKESVLNTLTRGTVIVQA